MICELWNLVFAGICLSELCPISLIWTFGSFGLLIRFWEHLSNDQIKHCAPELGSECQRNTADMLELLNTFQIFLF